MADAVSIRGLGQTISDGAEEEELPQTKPYPPDQDDSSHQWGCLCQSNNPAFHTSFQGVADSGHHPARRDREALYQLKGFLVACTRPHSIEDALALVLEVADPSLQQDLKDKTRSYARAGVPELWGWTSLTARSTGLPSPHPRVSGPDHRWREGDHQAGTHPHPPDSR